MEKLKYRILQTSFHSDNSPEVRDRIMENLRTLRGVRHAILDSRSGTLRVEYNLLETHLGEIVDTLTESGVTVEGSTFQKIRRRVECFMEKNERDNLTAPHHPCCLHPALPVRRDEVTIQPCNNRR